MIEKDTNNWAKKAKKGKKSKKKAKNKKNKKKIAANDTVIPHYKYVNKKKNAEICYLTWEYTKNQVSCLPCVT